MIIRFLEKLGRLGTWLIIRKIRFESWIMFLNMKRRGEVVIWKGNLLKR